MFLKINFRETREIFGSYVKSAMEDKKHFDNDLAKEAGRRLRQLETLMEIIATRTIKETNSEHSLIPSEKLWMFVESFYYLAFRTRNVIRALPGLSTFDSPGIREVRNQLLEHPRLLTESFSWGKASGPIIKLRRKEKEIRLSPVDVGLYANYLEFQTRLNKRLQKYIDEHTLLK